MAEENAVIEDGSATDDRGVPLKNLQAEMSRKLAEMEERTAARLEAITSKLEAFSAEPEPARPEPQTVDEREELRKISASPRRYVDEMIRPLREKNEELQKELEVTRNLTVRGMWEKMEDSIARLEGKKDWRELPAEVQNGVINIVKEKGWAGNPASALDAYEIFQARRAKAEASDPDRLARINAGTTEGSGRASGKTPVKTVSRDRLSMVIHPRDPGYKEHQKMLDDVQAGRIKVE